jgi:hypothetical protein
MEGQFEYREEVKVRLLEKSTPNCLKTGTDVTKY